MRDSKLWRALTWLIDIIFTGLLWTLCSLPVFTIGAASAALYYTTVKCVRHERGRLWQVYWKGFRENFGPGTKIWLLYLAAIAVGAANALAAWQWSGGFSPLVALGGIIFLPVVLTLPWMFAYLSRFENTVRGSLKFVCYLAARRIGRSLLLALELLGARHRVAPAADRADFARGGGADDESCDRAGVPRLHRGRRRRRPVVQRMREREKQEKEHHVCI